MSERNNTSFTPTLSENIMEAETHIEAGITKIESQTKTLLKKTHNCRPISTMKISLKTLTKY